MCRTDALLQAKRPSDAALGPSRVRNNPLPPSLLAPLCLRSRSAVPFLPPLSPPRHAPASQRCKTDGPPRRSSAPLGTTPPCLSCPAPRPGARGAPCWRLPERAAAPAQPLLTRFAPHPPRHLSALVPPSSLTSARPPFLHPSATRLSLHVSFLSPSPPP